MGKKPPLPTTHSETEADRFKDFARKIMSVPKEEIDQKQAEYHQQRIKERRAAAKIKRTPILKTR